MWCNKAAAMRGPSFPPWASREGQDSQGGLSCRAGLPVPLAPGCCWGCICCWVSALSPPQPWHSSSAEPQPPFCVVSLHPRVHPRPCSAVLSRPRLALGGLDLPRIVPGLGCVVLVTCVSPQRGRGWGGGGRALCHGRAPPTAQDPHTSGIPAEVPGGRGHSVPWSSHPTVLGTPFPRPRRCVLAAGGVLPAGSRVCARGAPAWQRDVPAAPSLASGAAGVLLPLEPGPCSQLAPCPGAVAGSEGCGVNGAPALPPLPGEGQSCPSAPSWNGAGKEPLQPAQPSPVPSSRDAAPVPRPVGVAPTRC
ncbi:hypothetical protein Nmel_013310 [Mimus melanotis]